MAPRGAFEVNATTWMRVKQVFSDARALPPSDREDFARRMCEGTDDVLAAVLSLMAVRSEVVSKSAALSRELVTSVDLGLAPSWTTSSTRSTPRWSEEDIEKALPAAGHVVGGRYALGDELGCGGFGVVYAAHDRIEQRDVAVKFVALTSRVQMRRYGRELAALRRARVPGVVELLDDGNIGPWAYLVMSLVEGEWFPGPRVVVGNFEALLPRAIAFLEALGRLHAAGVLHRDLKPGNVLVDGRGRVTIVDLGIAEDETDPDRLRRGRSVIGTPAYMAPERGRGRTADVASDLYAAGVILAEALSGETPGAGSVPDVEAPPDVVEMLERMLAARPTDRPKSAAQVLDVLRGHVPGDAALCLPRLGGDALVTAIVRAGEARRPLDLWGRPGSGKTRLLMDAMRELTDRGFQVLQVSNASDGVDPLAEIVETGARTLNQRLRERLVRRIEHGAVLFADDADDLDPDTRRALDELRASGSVIRVTRAASHTLDVPYLQREDLVPLLRSSNRLYFLRDELADVLWSRTRGSPARVHGEIQSWVDAGLAKWCDGLEVEPAALPRIKAAGVIAPESAHTVVVERLHESVLSVWDVLSIAGSAMNPRTIAGVLARSEDSIQVSLSELHDAGVVDMDDGGRAWIISRSPRLGSIAADQRKAWSHIIADQVPSESGLAFRHLVIAERYATACTTALEVARACGREGKNEEGRTILDAALILARRHVPNNSALYAELLGQLAEASVLLAQLPAIELARYHTELAPRRESAIECWDTILHAAALVMRGDPRGALSRLDRIEVVPGHRMQRVFHSVANMAAFRSRSIDELRRRTLAAVPWVRAEAHDEDRSLLSSWAGWLRFEEGRYAAATSLHTRAARLARQPRTRTTALANAAAAAIEAGDLGTARTRALAAMRLARARRDTVNLARVERQLRVIAYRANATLDVDEDLLSAASWLDRVPRGLTALCEAAIAWRGGRLTRAAALADETRDAFSADPHGAIPVLAAALAARCRGQHDANLEVTLGEHAATLAPVGVAAQAAALYAGALGVEVVPAVLVERALAWAHDAPLVDTRREVLTPREVLVSLRSRSCE